MTSFEIGLLIVVVYIAVYSIVNRICNSAEKCAYYHAVADSVKGENNGTSRNEKGSQTED